jgi:UDP-glucose 4-epimerase
VNTLAWLIADILNFKLKPVYVAARPGEVREITPSATKARKHLDYQTNTSLRAGLIETVGWIKKRGPRPFEYHLPIEIVNEKTPETWTKRML